jgi:hypothetical protein
MIMPKAYRIPNAAWLVAAFCFFPSACKSPAPDKPAAQPAAAAQDTAMPVSDAKTVHPSVIARFCNQPEGPEPVFIVVLKDSSGNIGGYMHGARVVDSPVFYMDKEGKDYAMFHIFGSEEEKAKNQPLIDALRKAFPVESPLVCP